MNRGQKIAVRELRFDDIELIAEYWLNSDPQFLGNMGVDLQKLPSREAFTNMLTNQLNQALPEKSTYALILELEGKPVGHCNVNNIVFGKEATMHLHIWNSEHRLKGFGTIMVQQSIPIFFERLQLQTLWCEPYVKNPAPNKTLRKLGFEIIKRYRTVPGAINFEQEVIRYKLTNVRFQNLKGQRKS